MWFKSLIGKKIEAMYLHPDNEELVIQFEEPDKSWYVKYPLDEGKILTIFSPDHILGKTLTQTGKRWDVVTQTTIYTLGSNDGTFGTLWCNIHIDSIGREVAEDEDIIFPALDLEQQYIKIEKSWDRSGPVEDVR